MSNKNVKSSGWRNILNLISYIAIVCIGLALLIGKIGGGSLADSLHRIAEILAYVVTAVSAFCFAVSRRHWAYWVVWIVCVVLIIVLMII